MTRVCAVDYGRTRTGVAFSDPSRTLAGETAVITEKNERALAQKLCALFEEKQVGAVAVGLPVNMDGSVGPQGEKCRRFAALLSQMSRREVTLIDERRTTGSYRTDDLRREHDLGNDPEAAALERCVKAFVQQYYRHLEQKDFTVE